MGLFHSDDVRKKKSLFLAECWFPSQNCIYCVYCQKCKLEKQAHKKTVNTGGTENNVAKATFSWFPEILKKKILKTLVILFFLMHYFYLLIWILLCQSMEGMELEDNLSRRRVGFLARSQGWACSQPGLQHPEVPTRNVHVAMPQEGLLHCAPVRKALGCNWGTI